MNVVKIAETLESLIESQCDLLPEPGNKTDASHLLWMLEKILSKEMSSDKTNRWIGYVQGVLVSYGVTDVEAMKALNRDNS